MTKCVTERDGFDLLRKIPGRGQAGDNGSGGEAAPGHVACARLTLDRSPLSDASFGTFGAD